MSRLVRYIILFVLVLCGATLEAEHLVGGEITYVCEGNGSYRVTMIIYRDCAGSGAPFDDPANISVYDGNTLVKNYEAYIKTIESMEAKIYDPCFDSPEGICVEKGVYEVLMDALPPNLNGYTLAYQRCCRNISILNIQTPEDVGTTITTKIPPALTIGCDDSPIFRNTPPLAICLGSKFEFDHSATDSDGDSLVYSFCDPYVGGGTITRPDPTVPNGVTPIPSTPPPYGTVAWRPGFQTIYPFNGTPKFSIDSITGMVTGTPRLTGQFLYGVMVEEYRNGVKIGETRREYQVNVVPCESNTKAIIDPPPSCVGQTVPFNNSSTTTYKYHWDFGVAASNTDTSSKSAPTFAFPDTGKYTVRLIANPGYNCADTAQTVVQVFPPLAADVMTIPEQCVSDSVFDLTAAGTFEPYTDVVWSFPSASPNSFKGPAAKDIRFPAQEGDHSFSITMKHGNCESVYEGLVTLFPHPAQEYFIRNREGCAPLNISLEDRTTAWTPVFHRWEFERATKSAIVLKDSLEKLVVSDPGKYIIRLHSYTTSGCADTLPPVSAEINVYPGPTAGFSISETNISIFDPVVDVVDESFGREGCVLFFGNEESTTSCQGTHKFNKPGKYRISQIVTNEFDCTDTMSALVNVENEYAFFIPNSFTPNSDGMNEVYKAEVVGAQSFELMIRDRWGNLVFYSTLPQLGWDGNDPKSGHPARSGVYVYQVKITDFVNEVHKYEGTLNLIR
jgi:gliding motility-associated-like protein